MSREKQIVDEMVKVLKGVTHWEEARVGYYESKAQALYNAGYCKQEQGEWIKDERSKFVHRYHCSVCNFFLIGEPTKYCEDCGSKMKGGE